MVSLPPSARTTSSPSPAQMTSSPGVPFSTLAALLPTMVAIRPRQVVSAIPNIQSDAVEVRTTIRASPLGRVVREATHGSGEATPGAPVQTGTSTPFLSTAIEDTSNPSGISEASRVKAITSGLAAVAFGAVVDTLVPNTENPAGAAPAGPRVMITVPPLGGGTEVSTG